MQNNTGKTVDASNSFYTSGSIHTVLLSNLTPDTTYYYRCPSSTPSDLLNQFLQAHAGLVI